jgi:type 2 lantibiotic biosynthesis protein LanM
VARQPFEPARALDLATQAGRCLAELSQRISRDAVSWFQLTIAADDTWRLEPAQCDLYNGLSGIALFFANLGAASGPATGGDEFRHLAEEALATSRQIQASPSFAWSAIGGHNGLGGWLYTRAHLARLWHDEQQLDGCEEEVATLATLLAEDRGLDIIAGAAGAIAGLLALHEVTRSPAALATATACGEHLLAHAEQRSEGGIAWPAIDGSSQPLTGFAHGTAGFAWALARLAHATGDPRFAATAREALVYERSFFVTEAGSWPDLREQRRENGTRPFFYAWCHGAPGIGLSRLARLDLLDDREAMTAEIHAAVGATLTHGFGMNHGLCHGDLGNLELIRRAAKQLDEADWQRAGDDLAARILEDIDTHGWRSGIGPGIDQPGLMTGLAGIGYGLLRLAAPEQVPSILTFDLPPTAT